MISSMKSPTNKVELIRSIQGLYNPKISVVEVLEKNDINSLKRPIEDLLRKGNVSVILVSDP
jgi:hypothetical protein